MTLLLTAVGGALGSLARYAASVWIHSWAGEGFPWGILAVNAVGSIGLGFVLPIMVATNVAPALRTGVAVGFFGAFTTMSTFGYDTIALLKDGHSAKAAAYVMASLAFVIAGTFAGYVAGTAWVRAGG
ncbi:MAG TPA: fluoride efflux transporter CrcB [Longimicrobiales bacterium]|nr:fluoride efflux transporter CrcB [Longimicrobiales bacterium]